MKLLTVIIPVKELDRFAFKDSIELRIFVYLLAIVFVNLNEPKIIIGDHFYANAGCHFLGEITFGDDVLIGPKTVIWGRDHGTKIDSLIRKQSKVDSPIIIGNNVWIGANVTILKGVKVGDNSIIGAGSVVVKNIPKNCIVAGNPAKIIKERK